MFVCCAGSYLLLGCFGWCAGFCSSSLLCVLGCVVFDVWCCIMFVILYCDIAGGETFPGVGG